MDIWIFIVKAFIFLKKKWLIFNVEIQSRIRSTYSSSSRDGDDDWIITPHFSIFYLLHNPPSNSLSLFFFSLRHNTTSIAYKTKAEMKKEQNLSLKINPATTFPSSSLSNSKPVDRCSFQSHEHLHCITPHPLSLALFLRYSSFKI